MLEAKQFKDFHIKNKKVTIDERQLEILLKKDLPELSEMAHNVAAQIDQIRIAILMIISRKDNFDDWE